MPSKQGPDRIPCEIIGCGRTFQRKPDDAPDVRVICGKHFRLAPQHMRRRLSKFRRRLDRAKTHAEWERVAAICTRQWDRIRDRCMQIAMGISS